MPSGPAKSVAASARLRHKPPHVPIAAPDFPGGEATEARLRASDEQFRAVVANIPGVVYRCGCDADWTMRFISDDIEDLVGYPADDSQARCVDTGR
jgi:PAS domain-containing protein